MSGVRSLVFPRSIAVVRASPRNAEAVGTVLRSGVRAWGVNPNRDDVSGLPCFPCVVTQAQYHFLFPATTVRWIPDGQRRSIEVTDYFFGPEASVQRGLDSGAVPQGRLMAESEQLIADLQRRVRDMLVGP